AFRIGAWISRPGQWEVRLVARRQDPHPALPWPDVGQGVADGGLGAVDAAVLAGVDAAGVVRGAAAMDVGGATLLRPGTHHQGIGMIQAEALPEPFAEIREDGLVIDQRPQLRGDAEQRLDAELRTARMLPFLD